MNRIGIYLKSILIPVITGGIIAFLISNFMDYQTLQKPNIAPPSTVFPIVWTIIYILMGISYGILEDKKLHDTKTRKIYYIQLVVNALWSIIFFILKWRLIAFLWIIILGILIAVMIDEFYQKDKLAGILQLPYLLWVIFASYLNLSIYLLNK